MRYSSLIGGEMFGMEKLSKIFRSWNCFLSTLYYSSDNLGFYSTNISFAGMVHRTDNRARHTNAYYRRPQ